MSDLQRRHRVNAETYANILGRYNQAKMADASCEVIEETRWGEHRLVIAHDPVTAQEQSAQRQGKIDALHVRAAELAGKLDAQDDGVMRRGRKLSDSGAKARFFHEVSDARGLLVFSAISDGTQS